MNSHVSQQIFNVNAVTDVYIMSNQNVKFEIFISSKNEKMF